MGTPVKTSKTSGDKEQPPSTTSNVTAPVYPDWSNFQGYTPVPPHGFFPAPMASNSQAHPYIWGAQHMMPPYGTPPPYVMYPPGAVYAHPSMPPGTHAYSPYSMPSNGNGDAAGAAPSGSEMDGKHNEQGKTSGASANGAASQSGESGSESDSDGSDEDSQNDSGDKRSAGNEDGGTGNRASGFGNGAVIPLQPGAVVGGVAGPTTNLNIGMDYWGSPGSAAISVLHSKVPSSTVPGEQWIQDERDLKRQKRKQSNRESARRSRLRKQAECEELAQRAECLRAENNSLRIELDRIKKEYEELLSQNSSLKEKLQKRVDSKPDKHNSSDDRHPKQTGSDVHHDKTS